MYDPVLATGWEPYDRHDVARVLGLDPYSLCTYPVPHIITAESRIYCRWSRS